VARVGGLARRGQLAAEEREREQVCVEAEAFEELGGGGVVAVAREPEGARLVDDAHLRGVGVEREFEAGDLGVVGEAGGLPDEEQPARAVNEGDGRARIAEPGDDGV
jgi:hypothetical protein